MPLFRPSWLLRAARATGTSRTAPQESFRAQIEPTKFPTIPTCPSPTCDCADMPPDLDIDVKTKLNGTIAPYSEHLVVASGQADWQSKIEDEKSTAPWGELVANVKRSLGRNGDFHDPYHNVIVSTSSFKIPADESTSESSQALLFPSFRVVDRVSGTMDDLPDFIKTFLLPHKLHPSYSVLSEEEKHSKQRDVSRLTSALWAGRVRPISSPTILICSHNSRDSRCGIIGPLLHAEFTQYINKQHTLRNAIIDELSAEATPPKSSVSHPAFQPNVMDVSNRHQSSVNVGMISHVGGHKFAGNVIIYIPPDYYCQPVKRMIRKDKPQDRADLTDNQPAISDVDRLEEISGGLSPLAGKGIWYGRVEPRHVEGIVEQTIAHGRIIKELFRGGVDRDGSLLRLPLY